MYNIEKKIQCEFYVKYFSKKTEVVTSKIVFSLTILYIHIYIYIFNIYIYIHIYIYIYIYIFNICIYLIYIYIYIYIYISIYLDFLFKKDRQYATQNILAVV